MVRKGILGVARGILMANIGISSYCGSSILRCPDLQGGGSIKRCTLGREGHGVIFGKVMAYRVLWGLLCWHDRGPREESGDGDVCGWDCGVRRACVRASLDYKKKNVQTNSSGLEGGGGLRWEVELGGLVELAGGSLSFMGSLVTSSMNSSSRSSSSSIDMNNDHQRNTTIYCGSGNCRLTTDRYLTDKTLLDTAGTEHAL